MTDNKIEKAPETAITPSTFSSTAGFELAQRAAKALAASSLVPTQYQGNVPNCLIAMEIANRIGASIFATMQSMHVIHGRPGFSAAFLIATVNSSGRFTPLRFRFEGAENSDAWGCRAYAQDRESGEECVGPLVNIALAKAEGWYQKKGSKWQTMPELMLHYRAAAFWTRVYAPEMSLGMQTVEEVHDVGMAVVTGRSEPTAPAPMDALTARLQADATENGKTEAAPPKPSSTDTDAKSKPAKSQGKSGKATPMPTPENPDAEPIDPKQELSDMAADLWGKNSAQTLDAACNEAGIDLDKITPAEAAHMIDVLIAIKDAQ